MYLHTSHLGKKVVPCAKKLFTTKLRRKEKNERFLNLHFVLRWKRKSFFVGKDFKKLSFVFFSSRHTTTTKKLVTNNIIPFFVNCIFCAGIRTRDLLRQTRRLVPLHWYTTPLGFSSHWLVYCRRMKNVWLFDYLHWHM
jgi:hypothetical protein